MSSTLSEKIKSIKEVQFLLNLVGISINCVEQAHFPIFNKRASKSASISSSIHLSHQPSRSINQIDQSIHIYIYI